ncbi:MAG TPA: hypothetical protein VFF73_13735 [Planctomycetota bacterium]|nr:hypothetical protein [Planctomycetota bacterium]
MIDVSCGCGASLSVPDSMAGKEGPCPRCGTVLSVPRIETPRTRTRTRTSAEPAATLRETFAIEKVRCACGVTSARRRGEDGACPACGVALPAEAR